MGLNAINDSLLKELKRLRFGPPVTHVYNPLEYARMAYDRYLHLYAGSPREVVLLGMNPGPWGMAQTGVPFGEIDAVKGWLKIEAPVNVPANMHPKRPVDGYGCRRSEVSGRRLWGWAQKTFETPDRFFARFFVANYCPLMFLEASGRNRTPNALPKAELKPLLAACDLALRETVRWMKPRHVVGVGEFAARRARTALTGLDVPVGRITHPSPANPKANQGWEALVEKELTELGIGFKQN
ncbi:MAG: single-stranded DNA-binding protein [Desulfobacterales bacterium]|nr:single-stranded DNA-binding protein [Desulfobacterales bacterium]